MLVIPLIAFCGFLLLYCGYVGVNLWHLHTYRIPGEPPHRLLYVLVPLIATLLLMSVIAFAQVPWNSLLIPL